MSVYDWSTTAANNDVADASINWSEDQAPSTVNNSARAMMAALAKFVKDTGGAITSTGSSNAYSITTNSSLAAHTVPVLIAFKANHSATGAATVTIDGLAVKPLKRASGAAIQTGDIVSGSIYLIAYEASADVYLVLNASGYDPANVAITGGSLDGVTITTTNTGLHILDTNASHDLILKPGSDITADRTLTITTGDSDRTLTISGNATISGTTSGTNTGDMTVGTTTGTVAAGDDSRITGAAQKSSNLSDLANAATAFGNIKQAATSSATGVVELATDAEAITGTDTARAVTPANGAAAYESLGKSRASVEYTADQTGVLTDAGKLVRLNKATAIAYTVPPNSSVAFPVDTYINFVQMGAGQASIAAGSGVTIRKEVGLNLNAQYAMATITQISADLWVLGGSLKA